MGILVSHPHVAAVSARLAEGLAREGKLAGYFTGLAFAAGSQPGRMAEALSERAPLLRNRRLDDSLAGRLHSYAAVELGARLAARAFGRLDGRFSTYNALFLAHDRAVSWAPWPRDTAGVYAYEDGALHTFRRAARRELRRFWDLPTPHYLTTEEIFRQEERRWPGAALARHQEPEWKRRRKDAELALATTIIVASTFTRSSLERLSVKAPIRVVPYGFPVAEFPFRSAPPSGKFRVLSVGAQDPRKGTPYLLEAWRRAALPDAELHLVGGLRLARSFLDRYAGLFQHWPHVPRAELASRYAAADVLVFPTLGDGFGLVMQEAMCCGTPVITTPAGGGPEAITDGETGWILPAGDVDALVEQLRYCAANRGRLIEMGRAARARAERWTWQDATQGILQALED